MHGADICDKVPSSVEQTTSVVILTIILDTFGKAPLQTLVHGLQTSRDGLVPELPRLRSYQLLKC